MTDVWPSDEDRHHQTPNHHPTTRRGSAYKGSAGPERCLGGTPVAPFTRQWTRIGVVLRRK